MWATVNGETFSLQNKIFSRCTSVARRGTVREVNEVMLRGWIGRDGGGRRGRGVQKIMYEEEVSSVTNSRRFEMVTHEDFGMHSGS